MGQIKKKGGKGRRTILFPGNKGALLGLLFISVVALSYISSYQRELLGQVNLYSKENTALTELIKENNQKQILGLND